MKTVKENIVLNITPKSVEKSSALSPSPTKSRVVGMDRSLFN